MKKIELSVKKLLEIDGEQKYQTINLFDVLDDSQRTETIVIADDVVLKNGKKQPLPKFYNITLTSGTLDCGDFVLSKESILPDGVDVLICKHSIQGLGDLIDILPQGIKKVYVRNKIFNDLSDENKHNAAKDFVKKYPDVIVYDERGQTLDKKLEVLAEIEKQKLEKTSAKTETVIKKETIAVKTDEYISSDDFIEMVRTGNLIVGLDDECLERYFKMARSSKSSLNLQTNEMQLEDGRTVKCVKKECLNKIVEYIQQNMEEQKAKQVTKKTNKSKIKEEQRKEKKLKTEVKKIFIGAKEVKETEIKKYISKSLLGEIKKNCGSDKEKLIEELNKIKRINVKPTDTDGKRVYCIENEMLVTLKGIDFKSVRCLCQSIEGNDAVRIVWAIEGETLICLKVFSDHGRDDLEYRKYIRDVTKQKINIPTPNNCMTIEDAIKSIKNDDPSGPGGPDDTDDEEQKNKKTNQGSTAAKKTAEEPSGPTNVLKAQKYEKIDFTDIFEVGYALKSTMYFLENKEIQHLSELLKNKDMSIEEKQAALKKLESIYSKMEELKKLFLEIRETNRKLQLIKTALEKGK